MRSAFLSLALLAGCGAPPSGGGAGPAPTAAEELEIRGALHDALNEEGPAGEQGRDRLIRAGAPAVPILLEILAQEPVIAGPDPARAMKEDRVRRRKTALILGEIRDRRAILPLIVHYDGAVFGHALEKITGAPLGDSLLAWREWYVGQPPASAAEIEEALREFRRQDLTQRLRTMQNLASSVRSRTGAAVIEAVDSPEARAPGAFRQVQLLNGRDLEERRAARVLLVAGFEDPDPNVNYYAHIIAVQLGSMAVQPLRPLAAAGLLRTRLLAIRTLGEIGDPRALPELGAALQDPESALRRHAAEALGLIGSPEAAGTLARGLAQERDTAVRAALLSSLVMAGQDRFEPLLAMLRESAEAREQALARLAILCRRAYTLAAQDALHLRLPVSQEAWEDYCRQQGLAAGPQRQGGRGKLAFTDDPARWRAWWAGGRGYFQRPSQGETP